MQLSTKIPQHHFRQHCQALFLDSSLTGARRLIVAGWQCKGMSHSQPTGHRLGNTLAFRFPQPTPQTRESHTCTTAVPSGAEVGNSWPTSPLVSHCVPSLFPVGPTLVCFLGWYFTRLQKSKGHNSGTEKAIFIPNLQERYTTLKPLICTDDLLDLL